MYNANSDRYDITLTAENVVVVVPHISVDPTNPEKIERQRVLLHKLLDEEKITQYICWYYSPLAMRLTEGLTPKLVVYDCMDELTGFKSASSLLRDCEQALLAQADILFTGGYSLYELKRKLHPNAYVFPSSIDHEHFEHARDIRFDPQDQDAIPHPRIGYYGVIDERLDIDLLEQVARLRPQWHFVMVGPVSKIDPMRLPNFHNMHYLGAKLYAELPHYLAGWDIAMIPFAHNEATRYISPTKTPEYLAAGRPVISTPITDVIRLYGNRDLVRIAGTADEFVRVAEEELSRSAEEREQWLERVDDCLAQFSWNKTWGEMMSLIGTALVAKAEATKISEENA